MPKNHLKAINAPKTWSIKRKDNKFITRPKPGAHSFELSIPLTVVIRDMLEKAKTTKEVKKILHDQDVLVNGKRKKDHKLLLGLLDVLSFSKANEHFLMLINEQNNLHMLQLSKVEAETKLSKITGKNILRGGKTQLRTLDGRSITVDKDEYKTGNTLLISIPSQKIKEVLRLEKGTPVLLYKGRHVGKTGMVVNVEGSNLTFKTESEEFQTKRSFALSIGKDKPIIKIK